MVTVVRWMPAGGGSAAIDGSREAIVAPMTTFVLTRHGETVWHVEDRYAGRSDIALTPRGEQQAERLARWSAEAGLAAVWASDLVRARRTAQPCADAAGLEVRLDGRLREMDFGQAEGLNAREIEERFPGALEAFERDPVRHHFPGAEDPRVACERAIVCLREIDVTHPDGRILMVGHGTVIRLVLCRLLGLSLSDYRRRFPVMRNGGLTEVDLYEDGTAGLLTFNDTPVSASDRL